MEELHCEVDWDEPARSGITESCINDRDEHEWTVYQHDDVYVREVCKYCGYKLQRFHNDTDDF